MHIFYVHIITVIFLVRIVARTCSQKMTLIKTRLIICFSRCINSDDRKLLMNYVSRKIVSAKFNHVYLQIE